MAITNKGVYTDTPRLAGQIATHKPDEYITTLAAEETILFGKAIMNGTAKTQAKVYAGASGVMRGVAGWSKDGRNADSTTDQITGYVQYDDLAAVENARIVVNVVEAVAIGDPVRIVHTAGTYAAGQVGDFATTAAAGETTLLGGAIYRSATSAAGLAEIEIPGLTLMTTTADT